MMELVKLLPAQIMSYWPSIRECIEAALPPFVASNEHSMLYIQEQLLLGTLECWVAHYRGVPDNVCGIMTTNIVADPVSGCRNLLVYTVTIIAGHPDELWELAAEKLRRYAMACDCAHIIAYSNSPHMIHIAEKIGADTSYRLITINL